VTRRLSRTAALRLGGAAVSLALAVFLVLLAVDAHAWQTRMTADDIRFRANPMDTTLWRPEQHAPFGLARRLLGLDDDLVYRRALREFRAARPTEQTFSPGTTAHSAQAQIALTQIGRDDSNALRASEEENLLGVLGFALATQDTSHSHTFVNNAVAAFREAIDRNPRNEDALWNLEYALAQLKGRNPQEAGGNDRLGQRGDAGIKDPGHGY
jgi:hypothetical protein